LTLAVAGVSVEEFPSYDVIWSSFACLELRNTQAKRLVMPSVNSFFNFGTEAICWINS